MAFSILVHWGHLGFPTDVSSRPRGFFRLATMRDQDAFLAGEDEAEPYSYFRLSYGVPGRFLLLCVLRGGEF